jgi:hypothetical protein
LRAALIRERVLEGEMERDGSNPQQASRDGECGGKDEDLEVTITAMVKSGGVDASVQF